MNNLNSDTHTTDATPISVARSLNVPFGCFGHIKGMHDAGLHEDVKRYMRSEMRQNTVTRDYCLRQLCQKDGIAFNDAQGLYAGTHYTYTYCGEIIHKETEYSLFN